MFVRDFVLIFIMEAPQFLLQCKRYWRPDSIPGEGNGNPQRYSCLGNPMDRGACGATAHGVTKNGTRLSTHTLSWNSGEANSELVMQSSHFLRNSLLESKDNNDPLEIEHCTAVR